MPLPEKEFFTMDEVAERWNCSRNDLMAYAMDGILQLSVWVPHCHVEMSSWEELEPGHRHSIPYEVQYRHGLIPLMGQDVGLIWSYGQAVVTQLANASNGDGQWLRSAYIPGIANHGDDGLPINADMLKLSGAEVRQFEQRYLGVLPSCPVEQSPSQVNPPPDQKQETDSDHMFAGRHGTHRRHRERVRAVAASMWYSDPSRSIQGVIDSHELILIACEGIGYSEKTLRRWLEDIAPASPIGRPRKGGASRLTP